MSNSSEKKCWEILNMLLQWSLQGPPTQASQAAGKIGKDRWQTVWGGQRAMLEPGN